MELNLTWWAHSWPMSSIFHSLVDKQPKKCSSFQRHGHCLVTQHSLPHISGEFSAWAYCEWVTHESNDIPGNSTAIKSGREIFPHPFRPITTLHTTIKPVMDNVTAPQTWSQNFLNYPGGLLKWSDMSLLTLMKEKKKWQKIKHQSNNTYIYQNMNFIFKSVI